VGHRLRSLLQHEAGETLRTHKGLTADGEPRAGEIGGGAEVRDPAKPDSVLRAGGMRAVPSSERVVVRGTFLCVVPSLGGGLEAGCQVQKARVARRSRNPFIGCRGDHYPLP
jgi:hypothetical protein